MQPGQAICLDQAVLSTGQAVNPQVLLRPFQIGTRHIHRGGATCAPQPGMYAGGAGVGKQVEEVFAFAHLTQHTASDAVIEE
ncbi:hypothetical protein D3C80_1634430 [compost metagenome]